MITEKSKSYKMDVQVNVVEELVPWIVWELTKIILKIEEKYFLNLKVKIKF
jgi:hypothetical protein